MRMTGTAARASKRATARNFILETIKSRTASSIPDPSRKDRQKDTIINYTLSGSAVKAMKKIQPISPYPNFLFLRSGCKD